MHEQLKSLSGQPHLKHHLELQQRRIYAMCESSKFPSEFKLSQKSTKYPTILLTAVHVLITSQTQDSSHTYPPFFCPLCLLVCFPFTCYGRSCICVAERPSLAAPCSWSWLLEWAKRKSRNRCRPHRPDIVGVTWLLVSVRGLLCVSDKLLP